MRQHASLSHPPRGLGGEVVIGRELAAPVHVGLRLVETPEVAEHPGEQGGDRRVEAGLPERVPLLDTPAELLLGAIEVSEEPFGLTPALIRVAEELGQPDLVHQAVDALLLDAELLVLALHREQGRVDLPEQGLRDDAVRDDRERSLVDPQGLVHRRGSEVPAYDTIQGDRSPR